jgi:hypothetical protein
MIELRFSADLYDDAALAAAARAYSKVATCAVESGPDYYRVSLTATGRVPEARIADEFGNYALGATVEGRVKGAPSAERTLR